MGEMKVLFVVMMAVLLSGCVADNDVVPGEDTGDEADAADDVLVTNATGSEPEPISIHEDEDLLMGMEPTTWTWTVSPSHTEARMRAVMTGAADGAAPVPTEYCFRFEVVRPTGFSSGNQCIQNDVTVSIAPGSGDVVFLTADPMAVGEWTVSFEAGSAVGRFQLDVAAAKST